MHAYRLVSLHLHAFYLTPRTLQHITACLPGLQQLTLSCCTGRHTGPVAAAAGAGAGVGAGGGGAAAAAAGGAAVAVGAGGAVGQGAIGAPAVVGQQLLQLRLL